jgi:hypothetical protein
MCVGVLCARVRFRAQPGLGLPAQPRALTAEESSVSWELRAGALERGGSSPKLAEAVVFGRSPDLAAALGRRRRCSFCLPSGVLSLPSYSLHIRLRSLLCDQRGHLGSLDLVASAPVPGLEG